MDLDKAPTLHEEDSKVTLTIRLIMQGKVRATIYIFTLQIVGIICDINKSTMETIPVRFWNKDYLYNCN